MIPALSPRPFVWLLDRSAQLADDIKDGLLRHDALANVRAFSELQAAVEALKEADRTSFPGLLITDRFGLDPFAGGKGFAESLQDQSPLTNILIHSRSLHGDPDAVEQWRARRFVLDCLDKEEPREHLYHAVGFWLTRYRDPLVARFREYVASDPEPDAKFFEGDRGEYLSLLDIYHELLKGTPFARELEPVWKAWLDDPVTASSA